MSVRPYRGISAEQRRDERRSRLVDAGFELLGGEGYEQTTVRGVCRRAQLTDRYFYESFADREALVLAVFDHVAAQAVHVVLEAAATAPGRPRAWTRAAIGAAIEWVTDDPRRGRVLLLESGSPALLRRRQEAMHANSVLLADVAESFFGAAAPPREEALLTARALVGAIAEVTVALLAGQVDVSRERVADHMTEMFLSVTGLGRRRARSSGG